MSNRIAVSYVRILTIFFVLLLAGPAFAGPLDRSSTGPRVNPAADDMIRVPGVVGMHYKDGLDILQQAGLSPAIKRIKSVEPRYEGREGEVVRQVPAAGGVAMIGSSVSITYYLPEGMEAPLPSDGDDEGEAEYYEDDGYEGPEEDGADEYAEDGEAHDEDTGDDEDYDEDDGDSDTGQRRKPAWRRLFKGRWKPPVRRPAPVE